MTVRGTDKGEHSYNRGVYGSSTHRPSAPGKGHKRSAMKWTVSETAASAPTCHSLHQIASESGAASICEPVMLHVRVWWLFVRLIGRPCWRRRLLEVRSSNHEQVMRTHKSMHQRLTGYDGLDLTSSSCSGQSFVVRCTRSGARSGTFAWPHGLLESGHVALYRLR
jgi:hypothetical protein